MRLSNGTDLERMDAPPGVLAAERTGREVRIMARGTQVVLQLRKRELLRDSVALAGAALPDAPLAVLLTLALTGHFDEVPDPITLQRGVALAESIRRAGAVLTPQRVWSAAEIRQAAVEALEPGQLGFELPDGAWNVARALIQMGVQAWRLEGAAAAWWGSVPSAFVTANDEAQMEQRMLLAHIAALVATPMLLGALPLPPAIETDPAEVWIDWMGLAAGPGTPPRELRPAGLGARGDSPLEAHDESAEDDLTLTLAQGEALDATGRGLLASLDRPLPRLLGRLLDVAIPGDLLPQIGAWGVAVIRVQVAMSGLWIAALDTNGRSLAAAWWRAEATSAERAPISFPPAAWALIHPVLAGLWHDLCADVVQVAPEAREDIPEATEAATEQPPTRQITYV